MPTLEELVVKISADTKALRSGMSVAEKNVKKSTGVMSRAFASLTKKVIAFTLTYLAVRTLTRAFNDTRTSIDRLAKTSEKLGITTEGLAGLRLAAQLTGVETRTLDLALQRMTRRIAEAAQGTGEAKSAIKELGLDAVSLSVMGPEKAFEEISDAMQNVRNESDKLRLAFKLFDSEGAALVNTLALGRDGLQKIAEEAKRAGLAVSEFDAQKITDMNDTITQAKATMQGAFNKFLIKTAPDIEAAIILITKYFVEWSEAITKVVNALGELGILGADPGDLGAIGTKIARPGVRRRREAAAAGEEEAVTPEMVGMVSKAEITKFDELMADSFAERREAAAENIVALQTEYASELDLLRARLQEELDIITEARDAEVISDEEFMFATERAEDAHNKRLNEILKEGLEARKKMSQQANLAMARGVIGLMGDISAAMNTGSREQFELTKIAAYGSAIVNTAEGITRNLAAYEQPRAGIMAGITLASGIAQIATISRTQFGGGGGVPSAGGAGSSAAATPQGNTGGGGGDVGGGGTRDVSLTLIGRQFDAESIRELMEAISEQSQDGVPMNITVS